MEKIFNKLVRDKIPEIIKKENRHPVTRILSDIEYKRELEKKLYEEYNEVLETKTSEERIEELADMYEIMCYLAKLENKTIDDVRSTAQKKKMQRGGFDEKIYLEKVIDNEL